ncbi:hypothetical protein [Mycobacteroides abscessus]|uniref:hypothetical protein n=1 Tax=Mycobacteroides abscessus TaxID=36809 RepID=UPI0009CAAC03|nr:hypothetical protein [Mycobacteroides abscessus]MBN7314118.1 hypothetical protein [Mycobacteroides abscessus subsp. abscessus]SKG11129.1 Uncharacterised protein [Mycobacteroides abscessus subsp. massiliense]
MISTDGDPIVQLHRSTAASARQAAAGLPTVNAMGMRAGHAAVLEGAIAETRRVLEELAHVADVGAGGSEALGQQDIESGRQFGGWDAPERQSRGAVPAEVRVI